MNQLDVILAVTTVVVGIVCWWSIRKCQQLRKQCSTAAEEARVLRSQYAGIIDLDAHLADARRNLEQATQRRQELDSENDQRRLTLNQEYEQALATFKQLKLEVSLLEENIEDISFGLYKPHFSFETSNEYKTALENLRERERQIIHDGRAAVCARTWTVGNSATEGARMVKLNEKLLLRAFNGECDAALANVSWNNVTKMEERIRKSYEAVNKLGSVLYVSITADYLNLRLDEVRLTHEYEEKKHQDREDQKRIREELREEEKAQREIEEAREEAEHEEVRFQRALEKAREEAAKSTGAQLQKLTEQISSFEAKLDEARKKKERAISRAQLTKSGFVYVISNIGSFGDGVYKIGMTRRMEPMERIDELGGASVPFRFDLHVMLYSDNAPELEGALHRLFEGRRLNLVNSRREFYRGVGLEEIETYVKDRGLSAQFIRIPEAKEYRESLAMQQTKLSTPTVTTAGETFSETLFPAPANG
jgi:hypothetical protein